MGRKGRGIFSPPLHPDFAPAMQASSVLSHCLSQTRNSCTINSDTLSFSSRCLNEYQPHRSWVTLWGARTPSKQNLVMFPPQDAHSELDILWFMVLYLVNYVLFCEVLFVSSILCFFEGNQCTTRSAQDWKQTLARQRSEWSTDCEFLALSLLKFLIRPLPG